MDDEITEHELQNQEIWTRVYFNGYFYKFIDMCLCVDIRVDPEQNDDGQIQISNTFVFPPIDEKMAISISQGCWRHTSKRSNNSPAEKSGVS